MQLGFAEEGSLNKKSNMIKACSVLHNIAKKFSVPSLPADGKIEVPYPGRLHLTSLEIDAEALEARRELIDTNFSVAPHREEVSSSDTTKEDV